MDRLNKLKINSIVSLLNRIVLIVSGFILPRMILLYYGSETNGLTSSVSQVLSVITFLDLGVGSVVQSALYHPLAKNDERQVSLILASAKKFFQKIAIILILYIFILMIFYPVIIQENIGLFSTVFLILAMSINLFAQYYFGIVNELLLNADQKAYIQLGTEIIVVILNLIASVFLIRQGFSIQMVKLISGLIYLIRPVFLSYYISRNYNINHYIEVTVEPITQKWNGMAQHIAFTVQNSTDIVVLTLFSTLENISIYSIYNMVVQGVRLLITSFTSGLRPFFGNLLASNEVNLLNNYFTKIEWLLHTMVIYLFGMAAVLINSFVMIYTSGVTDVNYYSPVFSILLITAQVFFSIRLPYQSIILAAGHYKQTQKSSVIEALLNVIISVLMVSRFGLIGVTLGSLCAMIYRTAYLAWYLSLNIINRPIKIFVKLIVVDVFSFVLIVFTGTMLTNVVKIDNIFDWLFMAVVLGVIFFILLVIINLIFYKKTMDSVFKKLVSKF